MFDNLREDMRRVVQIAGDGAAAVGWRRLIASARSPGLHAVVAYRYGHWLLGRPWLLRLLLGLPYHLGAWYVRIGWGIELDRKARIGAGLFIGHFGDIHVGGGVVLGRRVAISQGVTIGVAGTGERSGSPVVGDDAYIAPGAKLFGAIRVGNNVKIGANAVIHCDLPDNAVAALSPGFELISMRGNRRQATNRC